MMYQPHERDMVLLQHLFEIEWSDGKKETRSSTLLEFGIPGGHTAMARTVGIPCGIAVHLILEGKLATRGVLAPMNVELCDLIIEELEKEGIRMVEEIL